MKIKYLKIQNFKNISDVEINNFRDINIITGQNGEGKSSILQSLVFLLADSLSDKIEEFVKWGEDSFSLHVLFNHAGQEYDYEITGGKKGTKRTLYVNDKDNVYLNSDATKKLAEIMNPLLTLYSAISEQKNVDRLLFEKQADQLEKLKKLFGIEKLKDIVEDIKTDIKQNDTKLLELGTESKVLENRQYNFVDEPDMPTENVDELNKKQVELLKDKELFDKESMQYDYYIKELDKYNKDMVYKNTIEKDIEQLQIGLSNYKLKSLPKYNETMHSERIKEYNDLEKKGIILSNELKQYNSNLASLEKITSKRNIKIQEVEQLIIQRLPRGEEITEDSLKKLQTDLNRINVDLLQYDKKYSLCLSGKCPECEQEYHADIQQIEKDIVQLKSDKVETILVLESETNHYKEIEKIKKDNEKIQFQKSNIEKSIEELNSELKNIESTLVKPEGDFDLLQGELVAIKNQLQVFEDLKKAYDSIKKQNESIEKNKQEIDNKILVLQTTFDSLNKIEKPEEIKRTIIFNNSDLEDIIKKINLYNHIINEIEYAKKQNEAVRTEQIIDRGKVQKLQDDIANLNIENRQLESVKKIIDKEFSAWIISNGIDFIKVEMNKFFTKTYNKGLIVDIVQDKKGIEFLYGESIESLRTINMASGFEKTILAMSFRYALCGMQNLGIMILDEIDSDASDENSIKLFKMLLTNKDIQFFVVTHNIQAVDIMEQEYSAKVFEIDKGVLK